jgi:hypothetical protein
MGSRAVHRCPVGLLVVAPDPTSPHGARSRSRRAHPRPCPSAPPARAPTRPRPAARRAAPGVRPARGRRRATPPRPAREALAVNQRVQRGCTMGRPQRGA